MSGLSKSIKHAIWAKPAVYLNLLRWYGVADRLGLRLERITHIRPIEAEFIVRRNTDLVIEGFDRSANTFAQVAFVHAQRQRCVRIAHHVHAPAQIIRAVRFGIPAILLIRRPKDTVISDVLRARGGPSVPAALARLSDWMSFYSALMRVRDHVVVGHFDEVTSDFQRVLEHVNQKFGTNFDAFEHSEENVKRVFDEIEMMNARKYNAGRGAVEHMVARPSSERDVVKREFLEQMEADRTAAKAFGPAEELYQAYVGC